jgi:hypothetical protein
MRRVTVVLSSVVVAAAVIGGAAYYRYTHPIAPIVIATTATAPASRPATTVAAKRKAPPGPATQILDIVRATDPTYPTTQRLDSALDLRYAARIVLNDPVYLDNQGNLWVTRADGPEKFNFLKASESETATHVTRDAVVFALWSSSENGKWLPQLIVKNRGGKGYQLVDYDGRRELADPYGFDWERALVLPGRRGEKQRIIVPTATGVCAFSFDEASDAIAKAHQQLIDRKSKEAKDRAVQLVMDVGGVIAYVTNAAGTKGAKGVARFAPAGEGAGSEYKWSNPTGWPDHLLHLVPLLDGSVLQIVSNDEEEKDKIIFSLNTIAPVVVDQKKVLQLVGELSAVDPEKRDAAFNALTTYGPGISPLLEKILDIQPVEAQIRIRQLLKNKIEPSLGSMSLNDGKMKVVNRLPDGGVIFFAEGGVAIPRPDDSPTYVTPAWLCIRPGRAVELLPPALVTDLQPAKQKIIAWGLNDYVVLDPVMGPQWFIGNRLEPMLRKQQRQFMQFSGIDSSGRWVFKEPVRMGYATTQAAATSLATHALATSPGTQRVESHDPANDAIVTTKPTSIPDTQGTAAPTTTTTASQGIGLPVFQSTLIIDPHLPDITPRLPAWQLPASSGKVGWDKNDWPVIYMDVKPDPIPWALEETSWRVIDLKKEKVFTDPNDVPKLEPTAIPTTTTALSTRAVATTPVVATATHPSTAATTESATTQDSALNPQELLLVTSDGTRYYDGKQSLKMLKPDGTVVSWTLPDSAVGSGTPTLLRNHENLLFLCNAAGRIVRIRPTPDDDEPFRVDGVFTRGVPTDPAPLRIWLDSADRICIAHSGNTITILFTVGRIPPAIAEKMRPEDFPPDE